MRVRGQQSVSGAAATLAREAAHLKARSRWPNSTLPTLWFLTDEERTPDPVAAACHLPPGAGIILRHYRAPSRPALAQALAEVARAKSLVLLIGATQPLAEQVGAHGVHIPRWARPHKAPANRHKLTTYSVHGVIELVRAQRAGADGVFVGSVFGTKSHRLAHLLGAVRFSGLARLSHCPVIALGGIDAAGAARLRSSGAYGIGAIGALSPSTDD